VALLVVHNRVPRRGEIAAVLPDAEDPDARVRPNAGNTWMFIYVDAPEDDPTIAAWLRSAEEDLPEARDTVPEAQRVKNRQLARRRRALTPADLPVRPGTQRTTYRPRTDSRAYVLSLAEADAVFAVQSAPETAAAAISTRAASRRA
jgi:hypothetical protein